MSQKMRTNILKEYYKKGMTHKRSALVQEAARKAKCSERIVMTFVYNQNKKKSLKPDVKTVYVPKKLGSFQSFQREYAKTCKIYGRKYSNKDAADMWKRGNFRGSNKSVVGEIKMKGRTFLSKREFRIGKLVDEVKQANFLSFYARQTPCGQICIYGSTLLYKRIEKCIVELDKYTDTIRSVIRRITEEDEDFITKVMTGHEKIRKLKNLNKMKFECIEIKIILDLLEGECFMEGLTCIVRKLLKVHMV